jgi:predicted HAD superfamily hydrolase
MIIYSFDVFDTCLTRIYSHPTDLFYELAQVFLNRFCLHGYDDNSIKLFVYARKRAEREARNHIKQTREDTSLADIYKHLQTLLPWHFDLDEAISFEMEFEKQSFRPVLPIRTLINKLRAQKHKIIFISDMYLPGVFLKGCLLELGIAEKGDCIYVSGDIGLSKQNGSLFRHVLAAESIQASQLIHHGDNEHADVKIPSSLGIRTRHYKNIQLTGSEKNILGNKQQKLNQNTQLSKLVALGRYTRINSLTGFAVDCDINKVVTGVIAPLLTAYVAWVLRTAKSQGVDRLYFVSRDGQVLFKIAQELQKYISAPECRYLYGSRQAWFFPSVIRCDDENLKWITLPGRSTSVRSILARLDIDPEDIEELLINAGFGDRDYDDKLVDDELKLFKDLLVHNLYIAAYIKKKASEARNLLGQYLAQEQLNDGKTWAIVDVGWRLSCQRALKRVIDSLGWQCQVKGYYLELANDHLSETLAGKYSAYISDKHKQFSKRGLLIEHVFTPADHPTVIRYRKHGSGLIEPVLKVEDHDPDLIEYANSLHKTCCNYAAETAKSGIWSQGNAFLDDVLQKNALRLLKYPTEKEAQAIGWIPVILDQLHSKDYCKKLTKKITIKKLFQIILYESGLSKTLEDSPYWLEGSAVQSIFPVKSMLYLLLFAKQILRQF